jgi:hypothetical protein
MPPAITIAGWAALILWLIGISLVLKQINERTKLMATQADLDAAIAALPAAIEAAVESALAPVIAAIQAKAANIDLSPEIASLNAVGATVGAKVAADLTPPPAVTPATPATPAA